MPHYRLVDKTHIMNDSEMAAMYNCTPDPRERSWLIILWLTGARPGEVIILHKKDIHIEPDKTSFKLQTLKLKGRTPGDFYTHHRNLVLNISSDHHYIKTLARYLACFKSDDARIFSFNIKTGFNIVHNAAVSGLGFPLCPYNFRHSRLTLLAEQGASAETLKRFKGSFSDQSVSQYLHVRAVEYTLEV